MKKYDIYETARAMEREVGNLMKSGISDRNKELILEFKDQLLRENMSMIRVCHYVYVLQHTATLINKDLDQITKKDAEKFVSLVQQKNWSPWTRCMYKIMFKRMIKWIRKTEEYPEEVKWIKAKVKATEIKLPSEGDLFTEDDIRKILEAADHPRDKALIALLYESGCRIGELASMDIKNVEFDDVGCVITITGKTGPRKVRIISSTPFIAAWINMHPLRNDRNAPLWVNFGWKNKNKPIKYKVYGKLIKRLVAKAGIKKRANPHTFRHSRATFMANHLTEFQMNQYFGWVQGSGMPATYVHMSGKDLDESIKRLNGIKIDTKETESLLKPITCPRCGMTNSSISKFCSRCGCVLDMETAMEMDRKKQLEEQRVDKVNEVMKMIARDPEIRSILIDRVSG